MNSANTPDPPPPKPPGTSSDDKIAIFDSKNKMIFEI